MTPTASISVDNIVDRAWWQSQADEWSYHLDTQSFDTTVATLTEHLQQADGPESAAEQDRWCQALDLTAQRLAVWDFDYYLLIVWETAQGALQCRKQQPGWGIAPGRR